MATRSTLPPLASTRDLVDAFAELCGIEGLPINVVQYAVRAWGPKPVGYQGRAGIFDRAGQLGVLDALERTFEDPRWDRTAERHALKVLRVLVVEDARDEFEAEGRARAREAAEASVIWEHQDEVNAKAAEFAATWNAPLDERFPVADRADLPPDALAIIDKAVSRYAMDRVEGMKK